MIPSTAIISERVIVPPRGSVAIETTYQARTDRPVYCDACGEDAAVTVVIAGAHGTFASHYCERHQN